MSSQTSRQVKEKKNNLVKQIEEAILEGSWLKLTIQCIHNDRPNRYSDNEEEDENLNRNVRGSNRRGIYTCVLLFSQQKVVMKMIIRICAEEGRGMITTTTPIDGEPEDRLEDFNNQRIYHLFPYIIIIMFILYDSLLWSTHNSHFIVRKIEIESREKERGRGNEAPKTDLVVTKTEIETGIETETGMQIVIEWKWYWYQLLCLIELLYSCHNI